MKIKAISLIISSTIFLASCEDTVERKYVLENSTDHNVKIDFYEGDLLSKEVQLNHKGDSWETLYEEKMASGVDAFTALKADSVVITYDETKVEAYSLFINDPRNILYNSSYTIENDELYRYTFTEEDYIKADSI